MYFSLFPSKICVTALCQHLAPNRCVKWSQRAEGISQAQVIVYLSPRAVVTVGVKGHGLRFELLDDQVIFIQQSCGHLVGAPAVGPPTVPAGGVSCQQHWHRDKRVQKDTWVSPVLHSDGRLSIQLCSSEPFGDQVNDLPLQTQPTTQFSRSHFI